MSKYEVEIKEAKGSLKNNLFDKMAKNGDLQAIKLSSIIGAEVTIDGLAKCHIATDAKEFDMFYINTLEYGLVGTGSEIFINSVLTYIDEIKSFRIMEVKTKRGTTYKATPVLGATEEQSTDELPFEIRR